MIWAPAPTAALTTNFLAVSIKITIATSKSCGEDSQRFHTMMSGFASKLTAAGEKNQIISSRSFSDDKENKIW